MFEQPSTQEQFPTKREDVLAALKTKGKEDYGAIELLEKWIEQYRMEVEKIQEKKAHYHASILCSIDIAKLFYDAGYLEEALEDLSETRDISYHAYEDELYAQISILINEIEAKSN